MKQPQLITFLRDALSKYGTILRKLRILAESISDTHTKIQKIIDEGRSGKGITYEIH